MLHQYKKKKGIEKTQIISKNIISLISSNSYIPSINMVSIKENFIDDQYNEQKDKINENKKLIKIIANTFTDDIIVDFSLISSNPSIQEFKDIDQIFYSFEINVCTNEQTQEYDGEYSINDKS